MLKCSLNLKIKGKCMKILFYIFFVANLCFAFDLKSINNIKGDFIQIVTSDNNKIEYSGNFVATKGYNAYWEYIKPFKRQIFSNKEQVAMYEPNLSQAIIFSSGELGIVDIINNAKQDGDKIVSNVNGNTTFVFLDSNGMPEKIEYTDKLDNKNEIILNNVEINTKIDESIFIFNAPEGTDIIHSKSSTFKR